MRLLLWTAAATLPLITEGQQTCRDTYYAGCFAWPPGNYVSCRSGYSYQVLACASCSTDIGCGFLGSKAWCSKGDLEDYGCGCDKGTECLKQDCEVSDWTDWSSCSAGCDNINPEVFGEQLRVRTIITEPAWGGAECPDVGEARECSSRDCAKDCEVSNWGSWSSCNKVCSGGKQYRHRTVTQPQVGLAKPCPGLIEQRDCNTDECFWYTLTGRSGKEEVRVTDGNSVREFKLSTPVTLGSNGPSVEIEFKNDGKDKDVWFDFRRASDVTDNPNLDYLTAGDIVFDKAWDDWKCGSNNENKRCAFVRTGRFEWNGKYDVTFDGSVVTGPWSSGR